MKFKYKETENNYEQNYNIIYIIIKIIIFVFFRSVNKRISYKNKEIDKNNSKLEEQFKIQKNTSLDNIINTIEIKKSNNKITEKDNIPPEKYEQNVLGEIRDILKKGNIYIIIEELFFINGLIRKYKPKKILEIGVCTGGISAIKLNAIKDIDGANAIFM